MAAHENPRTMKLHDRTNNAVSLDKLEKVDIFPVYREQSRDFVEHN